MRQTSAPGNDNGRYTEGNPSLGIPATVVSAEAANFWQEEVINTMNAAGIPESANETDLRDAILQLIADGGGSTQQINFNLANNQAAAADITGLLIDKSVTKTAFIKFSVERSDDQPTRLNEAGWLIADHQTQDDTWLLRLQSLGDDAGVTFSITATGQVKYTSTNLTGASVTGKFRATVVNLLQ